MAMLFAPPPAVDPSALLLRGVELYKAGVYGKAAEAFQAAFELAASPTTALNLAQSLEGAGQPEAALRWYEKVLSLDAEAHGSRRAAAGAGQDHLQHHGYVAITCGPPAAALSIDGEVRGACPVWEGYLAVGHHAVEATAPQRHPYVGHLELRPAERRELTFDLPSFLSPTAAPASLDPGPLGVAGISATSPPPAMPTWVAYTLLGTGGVALIVGGIFYAKAAADAHDAPTGPGTAAGRERHATQSDFETHRALAYGGLGAGGLMALGGGAMLVFGGGY